MHFKLNIGKMNPFFLTVDLLSHKNIKKSTSLSVNYILHVLLEKGGGAFHLFENKIRFIMMNH